MAPSSQRLRRRLWRMTLAGAVLGALTLAACGSSDSSPVLDEKKIERAIERSSQAQRGLRASVTCPADVAYEKGGTFECIAVVGDVRTRFVVIQTDAAGHVRYEAR
jgi:Domain of unknown function (DUF4333)